MKVLITGGCGFLGSNIAASYIEKDAEVIVIDALFRNGGASNLAWLQGKAQNGQFRHYRADIADENIVNEIFEKHKSFDYVCHLGGQVAMTTSLNDPQRDFRTNALGSFNILEAVRRYCPDAMIAYSSTNKVYGDLTYLTYREENTRYTVPDFPQGFDERLPLDFASPYGCSKGAADQYVRDWFRNFGIRTVVFRHSSIYGGRQYATIDQGWIGWFCQKAIDQKKAECENTQATNFTVSGNGKQVRDVLHADDLIVLYHLAYKMKDTVAGEVFNIGGGVKNSLSILELFSHLEEKLELNSAMNFSCIDRRRSDQDYFVADIRKAQELLGWRPNISRTRGLDMMLNWVNMK